MIDIQPLRQDDIDEVAALLARRQQDPATHIGFCGSLEAEITEELRELAIPAEQSFVVARDNGAIVGAMGFDANIESARGFVWGPIAGGDDPQGLGDRMWAAVEPLIPAAVTRLDMFCNFANGMVRDWAERNGFAFRDEHFIMAFERADAGPPRFPAGVAPLPPEQAEAFAALHDATFPRTYYTGREILERINEQQQVFVAGDSDGLLGYAYVEVQPEHGQGSIEFVGVAERARGRGVGAALIARALDWMFSFEGVASTELVVDGVNAVAQRLYRRAGFRQRYHMASYRRDR